MDRSLDPKAALEKLGVRSALPTDHVFDGPEGVILFRKRRPAEYEAVIMVEGPGLGQATALLDEAIERMFLETDAVLIVGDVGKTNAASLQFARALRGVKEADDGASVRLSVTITRWAAARGLDTAKTTLAASGQSGKVQRLEALTKAL